MVLVVSANLSNAAKPSVLNPSINLHRDLQRLSTSFSTVSYCSSTTFRTAAVSASHSSTSPDLQEAKGRPTAELNTCWEQFAERVSGEWDGFGADFTTDGIPIELPESVVPDAYREWGVPVFDWQTQCPTLATVYKSLHYKLIHLLPTVGCEADAATRYSVDERMAASTLVFAYELSGCYIALWPVRRNGQKGIEIEHCLVDPRDRESRTRVVLVVGTGERLLELQGIKVFSEYWYGPYRNGEQLGGCAIREAGFSSSPRLDASQVVGEWQGTKVMVARTCGGEEVIFHELKEDKPQKCIRNETGLITLPKNLWCSLKENETGEIFGEVGWLLDQKCSITARVLFHRDRQLKEVAIGQEVRTSA